MTFEVVRRNAQMTFEGTEFEGLELSCQLDVATEVLLEFAELTENDSPSLRGALFRRWGDEILLDWNLTEKGTPVPASGAGVLSLPPVLANAILARWMEEVAGVTAPLGEQ